ncbi:RNA polymerase sigma-70 factor, ECF subfamily [Cohaesibacter sp. ES.047]|uniref:sigma-70 family RNA polymerase sigma factor n=1 Tax=Cohaesibacter sp. ES.047 TaxID=1798205 RepID=UPI000BB7A00D|nr:sigma-70 family RNA polymerase sigma factor [Cohaesibacter sp. ES.047]SNY90905.1 RNA polymerase sigma-70 factor, ECF subfamily [Cohaesibacter sp. ES.047]
MADAISDLIVRVALHDRAAFAALYQATSAKLFGICLRVLKDRAESEEVLQEAYVKIWNSASRFAITSNSPISWLAAIARNHAIDRLRARRPDPVELDEDLAGADESPDPERLLISAETGSQIEACLEELETQRAGAVRGAYLDGDSYQELAERFSVPLNTMRTWLRRSLISLRKCLEA